MKVHFIGGLEGDLSDYHKIISMIESSGWEVVTKHSIERSIDDVKKETPEDAELYAKKMKQWIMKADVVFVEMSRPGLGTGFEVAVALDSGKPVVALYKPGPYNGHFVLRGLEGKDNKLQVLSYNDDNLKEVVRMAIDFATDSMDTRFNFFISPKHQNYLDWVSKKRRVPRAVYLRRLIEDDMKKTKEYEE